MDYSALRQLQTGSSTACSSRERKDLDHFGLTPICLNFGLCASRVEMKSGCATGCENSFKKGCGLSFYHFLTELQEPERRKKWISAVSRRSWILFANSRICSVHFVGGAKSDGPLFTCIRADLI